MKKEDKKLYLISQTKGILFDNKSLNIPGAEFPFPVLIDRDFEGLKLAQKNEIDFIALSFVRNYSDIRVLKTEMEKLKINAQIVAKIETKMAIEDIDAIIDESDVIMVARGDLGIEIALEKVPFYQKQIIRKCLEKGKPVITATQMLQSMIVHKIPTRAEISDVANAAYDLTDSVMLSAESATGKYPVEAVKVMTKTLIFNEFKEEVDIRDLYDYSLKDQETRICDTAYNLYLQSHKNNAKIAGFIVLTQGGRTAKLVARYRPRIPIFAFCPTKQVAESLSLAYGVHAFVQDECYKKSMEVSGGHVRNVIYCLTQSELVRDGDQLIVIHGDYWSVEGGSSTVKLVKIG